MSSISQVLMPTAKYLIFNSKSTDSVDCPRSLREDRVCSVNLFYLSIYYGFISPATLLKKNYVQSACVMVLRNIMSQIFSN